MSNKAPVTAAYGEGIGSEIMAASPHVIKEIATQAVALLNRVLDQDIEIVKTENLRTFDGKPGYTLAQGQ